MGCFSPARARRHLYLLFKVLHRLFRMRSSDDGILLGCLLALRAREEAVRPYAAQFPGGERRKAGISHVATGLSEQHRDRGGAGLLPNRDGEVGEAWIWGLWRGEAVCRR